jgi:hypothetical protein
MTTVDGWPVMELRLTSLEGWGAVGKRVFDLIGAICTGPDREFKTADDSFIAMGDRSSTTYEERVKLDVYYVENWSLSMDVSILARTLVSVAARKGAV